MKKERDRLIELMRQGFKKAAGHLHEHIYNTVKETHYYKSNAEDTKNIYEICADYLLENGVIVSPCKVGDTVYCIIEGFNEVMEGFVRQFIVAEGIFADCVIRGYFNQVFHSSQIGKTVFTTKEKAKQALKGGVQE